MADDLLPPEPPPLIRSYGYTTDYKHLWYTWTTLRRNKYTDIVIKDILLKHLKEDDPFKDNKIIQAEIAKLWSCIEKKFLDTDKILDKSMKTGNQTFPLIRQIILAYYGLNKEDVEKCRDDIFHIYEEKNEESPLYDYGTWIETHQNNNFLPRPSGLPTPFGIQHRRKSKRKSKRKSNRTYRH